ncbi:uncharacterized protein LAJ45_00244 [Morchella importuna]|uniref:uncharacterized protein n=1 Tax=Morchella importuna TaxID=1174673 RepID=UPI001E8CC667|nr:uncharacterized protein LAJ45_00244 [Morchella importuna]KAH8155235.1 hypothetical protein LAJ45_00244 [Morchella importuna]
MLRRGRIEIQRGLATARGSRGKKLFRAFGRIMKGTGENGLRPPPLLAMINTWALTPHPLYCSSVKNSNTHPPSSSSNLYPRISSSRIH